MREIARENGGSTGRMSIALMPAAADALREAMLCLDSAGQALGRGRAERTDEVIALLQAAAGHLKHAWDQATDPSVPPHMRGAE